MDAALSLPRLQHPILAFLFFPLSALVCVHLCVCVPVCMVTCVHVCAEMPTSDIFLDHSLPYSFERASVTESGTHRFC